MDIAKLFDAIKIAATSNLALVAYLIAAVAWIVFTVLKQRASGRAKEIIETFKDDKQKNEALRQLLGKVPPKDLPDSKILEWARQETRSTLHLYLLIAYLVTLLAGIILVVLTSKILMSSKQPSQEEIYQAGIAQLQGGYYSDAIKKFDEMIRKYPDHARSYASRGIGHYMLGEFQQALKDYTRARELDPENPDITFNLGAAYLSLSSNQQALEIFDALLKKDPNDVRSRYNLGLAYQRLKRFDEMRANYEAVIGAGREKAEEAAFNLAAGQAMQIDRVDCASPEAQYVVKYLSVSLGFAAKQGRTTTRVRAISGKDRQEGTEHIMRMHECQELKALITKYE